MQAPDRVDMGVLEIAVGGVAVWAGGVVATARGIHKGNPQLEPLAYVMVGAGWPLYVLFRFRKFKRILSGNYNTGAADGR